MAKHQTPARRPPKTKTVAKPKQSAEDTEQFLAALREASIFADVHLSEGEIQACADRIVNPHGAWFDLWDQALHDEMTLRATAKRPKVLFHIDARTLFVLFEGWQAVTSGEQHCLPARYAECPEHARRFLFQRCLAQRAIDAGLDPLLIIQRLCTYVIFGPLAAVEIQRRAQQHVGFPYGAMPLIAEAREDDIRPMLDALIRIAKRHTRQEPDQWDAVNEALWPRFKNLDALAAAADALDGKFDVLPKAVHDQARKRQGRDYASQDVLRGGLADELEIKLEAPDMRDPSRLLDAFLSRYPEHVPGIEALTSPMRQEDLASRRAVSVKTLWREAQRAEQALRDFLSNH